MGEYATHSSCSSLEQLKVRLSSCQGHRLKPSNGLCTAFMPDDQFFRGIKLGSLIVQGQAGSLNPSGTFRISSVLFWRATSSIWISVTTDWLYSSLLGKLLKKKKDSHEAWEEKGKYTLHFFLTPFYLYSYKSIGLIEKYKIQTLEFNHRYKIFIFVQFRNKADFHKLTVFLAEFT